MNAKDVYSMDEIFLALLQAIEEEAFPLCYANSEYRREQSQVLQQLQWLEERLTDEGKVHLEQLRQAELRVVSLECEAEIKLALAVGMRLALAC